MGQIPGHAGFHGRQPFAFSLYRGRQAGEFQECGDEVAVGDNGRRETRGKGASGETIKQVQQPGGCLGYDPRKGIEHGEEFPGETAFHPEVTDGFRRRLEKGEKL